jgi:hypothetical protein
MFWVSGRRALVCKTRLDQPTSSRALVASPAVGQPPRACGQTHKLKKRRIVHSNDTRPGAPPARFRPPPAPRLHPARIRHATRVVRQARLGGPGKINEYYSVVFRAPPRRSGALGRATNIHPPLPPPLQGPAVLASPSDRIFEVPTKGTDLYIPSVSARPSRWPEAGAVGAWGCSWARPPRNRPPAAPRLPRRRPERWSPRPPLPCLLPRSPCSTAPTSWWHR